MPQQFAGPEADERLAALDEELVYATIRLGRQIGSAAPEMDADATSDIHVLLQVRSKLYSYQVYSLAGQKVKLRQERYYVPDGGVPQLTRSPGYIKVANGKLARPQTRRSDQLPS